MKVSAHVRVSGPLAQHAAGFAARLTEQGYTDLSLANQLRLLAHLSRWLAERELSIAALTPKLVERYLALRRKTRTAWRSRRGLDPLLRYLGLTEAVAAPGPERSELHERYERHLVERGLSIGVRVRYLAVAAELLEVRPPHELTGADVMQFARRLLGKPDPNGRLSALRSVLRFLHVAGETPIGLAAVVPSTTCWRLASLPKALEPAQVRAVMATPDRRGAVGSRDYAVLLLMLRLGLRACEVAALTLDDLDWTRGEIVVRGKGSTSRLPLPRDVGEALVAWLRHRRRAVPTRAVFLCSCAPYGAACVSTIVGLAGRVLRDAGVPTGGGHRLRHTAATTMLRRGASMTEIAQVLRHRHVDTTAIYAKVDRAGLRTLAQPWPADVRAWLAERAGDPDAPAFPSRRHTRLSRDAVERLVAKYAVKASARCSTLRTKRVTPHVLRHTTAVTLLHAGNDRAVIALWLGHESIETTQMYLDADLTAKERALARTAPLRAGPGRFRPDDALLAFLQEL